MAFSARRVPSLVCSSSDLRASSFRHVPGFCAVTCRCSSLIISNGNTVLVDTSERRPAITRRNCVLTNAEGGTPPASVLVPNFRLLGLSRYNSQAKFADRAQAPFIGFGRQR